MKLARTMMVTVGALALTSAAHAQSVPETGSEASPGAAAAEQGGLQDIVVTAQKRAENLQTVPIAVSAVGGALVESLQAPSLHALYGKVPSIQLNNFANTPDSAVVTIRGIGVIEPDPYAGNTVSIVVDGVPQYFSMGALVDLYDVDRIEILRGPQGTLFGANTTGGVVNIVTKQPTGEFGGKAEVTYGNWGRFDIKGALDVPISDTLSAKFVASHFERNGFVTNVVNGRDMDTRNVEIYRAYLKYRPSSNFDATLIGEYVRSRNGTPTVINGAYPGEILYVPPGTANMYVGPCQPGQPCHAPDKYFSANDSVPNKADMNTYRGTLTMNLRDTPIGDITSITGYKKFDLLTFTDQDATPIHLLHSLRDTKGWQFSQEIRDSVDITDAVNVIFGGFYLKDHYHHYQGSTFYFSAPGLLQNNDQDQDNSSISAFAQSYIDITDRLRAQAGIRYTHEKTSMRASTITSINMSGVTDFFGTGNVVLATVAPPRDSNSWNNVGWKLGLDYKITDETLVYGYWARGFKSGGYAGRIGIPQDLGPYGPEKVDTFEIGFKTDLLDRHLRINAAAFYTNYRDMQLAQIYFDRINGLDVQGNTIINAAKSHIKGFEADVTALPFEGFTLTGSVSYLDAKYEDFPYIDPLSISPANPQGVITNLKGQRLQNAPKWAASATATYIFDVAGGSSKASLSYSYVGKKYLTAIVNVPRSTIQPTHIVDGNVEWTPDGSRFTFGAWVRNLFDNRYMAAAFDSPGFGGFVSYMPPREYGVTAKVTF